MRGFSIMELMIVMIIVGILAAITIPIYITDMEQTKAQAAENNLNAIAAAQQKYFEDYGVYCTTTTGNVANCGNSGSNLSANLHLNFATNDPFYANYSCLAVAGPPVAYSCATNDSMVTLDLTATAVGGVAVGYNVTCPVGGNNCPPIN